MSETTSQVAPENPKAPTTARATPPVIDLSAEIVQAVERRVGDQVKCTRITADTYRCNWWAAFTSEGYDNPGMSGLLVTTHRVRQSRFLRVTKNSGKLEITDTGLSRPARG